MDGKTCENCNAQCCKYVALEIDCPEDLKDFEDIKWYVCHEDVFVYVEEDGTWNLEFITPCRFLNEKSRCINYENRPQICREYNQDECTFHNGNEYKEIFRFEKIEDVERYIREIFNKGLHIVSKDNENEKKN